MSFQQYLNKFGDVSKLNRDCLLNELDSIWNSIGLDNKKKLSEQIAGVSEFYSHPVWILNGLFSEFNLESRTHRKAIASYIVLRNDSRVADFGGGSGVLARFISEMQPNICVDIIEPYPFDFFVKKVESAKNIKYVPNFTSTYDVVIAQDVLEHVDNPIKLALELIGATNKGGHLIFANSFYPDIKCHLPSTFYLRHQFKLLMRYAGLEFVGVVPGAQHAQVFQRVGDIEYDILRQFDGLAKKVGPSINGVFSVISKIKSKLVN